jgi:TrmH family RNA methyltransferase
MKILTITKENAQFQVFNALKTNKEKRNKEGFLFGGTRNIEAALANGWAMKSLLFSSEMGLSPRTREILQNSKVENRYDLSRSLFFKLRGAQDSSDLLAVAEMRENDPSIFRASNTPFIVILDRPSAPHALGTIIRSCEGAHADGLIITGSGADPYDPASIEAAGTTLFSLPIIRFASQKDIEPWILQMRTEHPSLQVVGIDKSTGSSAYEHSFAQPTILLIGNEESGLGTGYRKIADAMVKVPLEGSPLHAGVAASIILSEIKKQRGL